MLIRRKSLFWFGGMLLFVGGTFLVFPPYAEYCESNYANDYNCAAYKVTVALSAWLDLHASAITALFTVILAISTIWLWKATNRSAKIAERALTDLETPFPIIKINAPGLKVEGNSISFGLLQYCVVNYGKTPAAILELCENIAPMPIGTGYASPIDPLTKIGQFMPYGVIAPPVGQSDDFPYLPIGQFVEGIILKTTTVFFYGFVRYEDILKNRFVLGFCFEFEPQSNRWIITGDDKYNYRRKETKPEADARKALFAAK